MFGFGVILDVGAMDPVHGVEASQVGHKLPLQSLESGEVVLPRSRIVYLVQENNSDM